MSHRSVQNLGRYALLLGGILNSVLLNAEANELGFSAPSATNHTHSMSITHRLPTNIQQAEILYREAVFALRADKTKIAISKLQTSLAKNPDHIYVRLALATIWTEQGNIKSAISLCEAGLLRQPNELSIKILLARIYTKSEQYTDIVKLLSGNLVGTSQGAEANALVAFAQLKTKNYQSAIQLYQRIQSQYPHVTNASLGLALSYEYMGEEQQALNAYIESKKYNNNTVTSKFIDHKVVALQFSLE